MDNPVDLRSDTVTRPTPGMRDAMARAEVGDDVLGEDPSVNALQDRAAALMGKEAALLVPTGTMANLVSVLAQTHPGDAIVLSEYGHHFHYEAGNLGAIAGLLTKTVPGGHGVMDPDWIAPHIVRSTNHHFAQTALIEIENTVNRGGGAIYPLETVQAIGVLARSHGMRLHMDGARILNACIASGVAPAEVARHCDTVCFCLSKGLGCPAGSLVTGDADTIDRAHRYRKMLGGGMRQAGVLAAAGLYALDHHVERLADDHRRARAFRAALEEAPGIAFPMPTPTNIVFVDVQDAAGAVARLKERGVLVGATSARRMRVVFHLDVDDAGLERAIAAFRNVLAARTA